MEIRQNEKTSSTRLKYLYDTHHCFCAKHLCSSTAHALIMTRDIVKDAQGEFTREDIEALMTLEGSNELALETFSENSLKEMANGMGMTNVRNITTKRIVLDRWPGAMLEFTGDQQRLDFTITMYNRMYIAIYKNYMISLHCQIGKLPGETKDVLKTRILQFTPLFHLMANSLVIQNQYHTSENTQPPNQEAIDSDEEE